MENYDLVVKRLKKSGTAQLVAKLQKGNLSNIEKSACVEILEQRGKDVSEYKEDLVTQEPEVVETVEEVTEAAPEISKLDSLKEEVDTFIDQLIEQKRSGVYSEVMKALGGKFESDLEELLENATEEQLKEALSFRNITKGEKTEDKPKQTTKKKESSKDGKSTLELYVEKHNNDTVMTEEEIKALGTKRERVIACWFSGIREIAKISEIADYARVNVSGIIRLANLKSNA